ncbi:hypothetical protein L1887_03840 [Cichorium endivia]|nr:hypothetical protein L1887_03840 [Cichorium endivia]
MLYRIFVVDEKIKLDQIVRCFFIAVCVKLLLVVYNNFRILVTIDSAFSFLFKGHHWYVERNSPKGEESKFSNIHNRKQTRRRRIENQIFGGEKIANLSREWEECAGDGGINVAGGDGAGGDGGQMRQRRWN